MKHMTFNCPGKQDFCAHQELRGAGTRRPPRPQPTATDWL